MRPSILLLGVVALWCLSGCNDDETAPPSMSIYVVPESLDQLAEEQFFDHPWPSDFRLEDGVPRFEGFPNPRQVPLLDEYLEATKGLLEGFSPAGTGYLRFETALDPSSLPANPVAATDPAASVQLIDIDPSSPEYGARRVVMLSFREPGGVYMMPNTLRFMPAVGFPLRVSTSYALVVTRALRNAAGGEVQPSAHLRQVLGLDPADGARVAAQQQLAPAIQSLGALGIGPDQIAHLAVFRTSDPTAELRIVQQHLRAEAEAPDFLPGEWQEPNEAPKYVEYLGRFGPSPNYQAGDLPFDQYGDGGEFNYAAGQPEIVDTFDLRFSLTVPQASVCAMPAEGFPIVLYAHGTGGSYTSHRRMSNVLAEKCVASMGVDQIFHGDRPGAPSTSDKAGLLFFNFQNVIAARTNGRQSALDEVQRARLFTETLATIPASVSVTGEPVRFDPDKVLFIGHSQGGLNGPLYLAVDDSARGGVLSASGSVLTITLLEKTKPEPAIPYLVKTLLLSLGTEEYEEFDLFHPVLSLAQWLVDPVDTIHYARMLVREPPGGQRPKSIYMTEGIGPDGIGDSYAPPRGIEAQGIAIGLPLQLPGQYAIHDLAWGGPVPVTVPPEGLAGNLADGESSGIFAQWAPPAGEDGHFVMFDVPEAKEQAAEFVRLLAAEPAGHVPAP